MRTIHADLKTAQEALSATPYIYLNINNTNYSSKLISFEWVEEPYRDRATIVLDNHDRALDPGTVDLRGKPFTIGTGYVTGSGNRYNGDGAGSDGNPTLWVKSQLVTSLEGESVCLLYAEGMWMKLRELYILAYGEAPYYQYEFGGTQTIKTVIGLILAQAGMTLNASYGNDGIINTFMPFLTTNLPYLQSLASLIYNTGGTGLIQMTKCYLRPKASLDFVIVYPQSSDSVNETYYSDQIPYFKEYTEKYNLLLPNDIKVFWGYNKDTGEWSAAALADPGSAVDQTSIDAYTTIREIVIAPDITTHADADNRAAAILQRYKSETLAGRLVLPYHDCSVELYDRVEINDARGM